MRPQHGYVVHTGILVAAAHDDLGRGGPMFFLTREDAERCAEVLAAADRVTASRLTAGAGRLGQVRGFVAVGADGEPWATAFRVGYRAVIVHRERQSCVDEIRAHGLHARPEVAFAVPVDSADLPIEAGS